jgi:MauM/NapG family ferredoxin protein
MRTLRRVSQIVFIGFFVFLFFLTIYPLEHRLPVDLFLRIDPLVGIAASMSSRTIISKTIIGLFVLLLTIVFGRFFCGWLCPLGTTIDGTDSLLKAKSNNVQKRHLIKLRFLKYSLLVVFLLGAVFSVQMAGYLDPIPVITRTAVTVLYPLFVFFVDGLLGFLSSIGMMQESIARINDILRGNLLPVSTTAFRGSVWFGLMFFCILLASIIQKRFWCRNLCPLGALFGLFSTCRWYRRVVADSCTSCKRCYAVCRMGAIHANFKETDHAECINCMDCQGICPVHAVKFCFMKKPARVKVDFSKRQFMGAGVAGIASLGLAKIGFTNFVKKGKVIRPPGALEENRFLDRCVRCGECIRICSTSGKGLQVAGLESGWEGLGTPLLHPPEGYCEYNCNLCGHVCPTGAIPALTMDEKHQMKMGTAHFDKTRCIPWYYGDNCLVCEEHCPVPEKAIQFRNTTVTTIDGRKADVLLPFVEESACIGCGICVKCCPLEAEKGIFLTNAGETRS